MKRLLGIATLALLISGSALAQNLVTNGGFETGDLSGWTFSTAPGDAIYSGVCQNGQGDLSSCSGRDVFDGTYMGSFGPISENAYLSQTLSSGITAGHTYDVSFWLQTGPSPNYFSVSFNGVQLAYISNAESDPAYFLPWTHYTLTGVATGDTADLEFTFWQPQDYWELDDVSVVDETPEPASLTLLGSALGLGAGFIRRFRS